MPRVARSMERCFKCLIVIAILHEIVSICKLVKVSLQQVKLIQNTHGT